MPGHDDPGRRRRIPQHRFDLPAGVQRAELYFTPDALDLGRAELSAQPAWPGDHVMVSGPYPPERTGLPFILPALAHC